MFDAHGDANQVFRYPHLRTYILRHGHMGHCPGVLNEGFDASQGFGKDEKLYIFKEPRRLFIAAFHFEGKCAAETAGLTTGEFMLRMTFEAGMIHAFDLWMHLQPFGNGQGIMIMDLHAQGQGFESTQDEKAIVGRLTGAQGILVEVDPFRQFFVINHNGAVDDVGMAIDILGRRVEYRVDAW
jgi:hypothetical protein